MVNCLSGMTIGLISHRVLCSKVLFVNIFDTQLCVRDMFQRAFVIFLICVLRSLKTFRSFCLLHLLM